MTEMYVCSKEKVGEFGDFFSDVKRVFVDDVRQHHDFFDEILTKFWPFLAFFGAIFSVGGK